MEIKKKPERQCTFLNVTGSSERETISKYAKHPPGVTSYIIWFCKENPEDWGLTLKAMPSEKDGRGFASQHIWKISWCSIKDEPKLKAANHCKEMTEDIESEGYDLILNIFKRLKKN